MEILQLKYFCEAAESENFSRTAKKFGVPPSDVSQSIKRLETELGARLFIRYPNRLELSERGRAFYGKCSEALALLSEAAESATGGYAETYLKLCVNCNRRIVMEVIERFRALMPGIRIEMDTFADPALGNYGVIVAGDGREYERYRRRLLLTERILLAVPVGHRLAERDLVDPCELASEQFIEMSELSSLSAPARAVCRAGGFSPKVSLKTDDPFYFRRGVEMGLGVALVPEFSWRGQFSERIRLIPCGDFSRDIFVYTDKTGYRGGAADRFAELLFEAVKGEGTE